MKRNKRSEQHEQRVQELRRSNAAGAHGEGKYSRREKYPTDYMEINDDEIDGDDIREGDYLV